MSDEKFDSLSTGSHRAWVGETATTGPIVRAGVPRENAKGWLSSSRAPNSRHSAITGTLHTFPNYKSWAEKIKNSWDKEKGK